jgi:hypothetical protein
MARRATGSVVERERGRGRVYGLRFTAYGTRRFLTLPDGTTRAQAEQELQNVLADVRRGVWRPDEPPVDAPASMPTFHEFASAWFEAKRLELAAKTVIDYRWRLSNHLLPYFQHHPLNEIGAEQVDAYRTGKVREAQRYARARENGEDAPKPLSNASIDMTIRLLAAMLEQAVDYGYIDRNPARGSKRLLRQAKPSRSYLQPDQVAASSRPPAGWTATPDRGTPVDGVRCSRRSPWRGYGSRKGWISPRRGCVRWTSRRRSPNCLASSGPVVGTPPTTIRCSRPPAAGGTIPATSATGFWRTLS